MSTTADLIGLGMPPALASRIGNTPASIAGIGTTQTGAAVLSAPVCLITPASTATAFILNSAFSSGRPIWVWNQSTSVTAGIFPPSGGAINGGAVNAAIFLAPLSGAIFQLENGSGVSAEIWGAIVGASGAGGGSQSLAYVQAPITLTSQTAAQPAFVGTGGVLTNGEVTLPVGTYEFVGEFNLSALSASSGGFGFALGTANSAVIGAQSWSGYANKATLATPAAPQFSWNTAASTELATATTATVGFFRVEGTFTLTTAGSIIPEISLTVAAAAIVGVGSYFKVIPLGSPTVTTVGNWS